LSAWSVVALLCGCLLGLGAYALQLRRRLERYERHADAVHVLRQQLLKEPAFAEVLRETLWKLTSAAGSMRDEGVALVLEAMALELRKKEGRGG
jgi:hypothetical protein